MVSTFETGQTYQFVGGKDYRHKFWNKSKTAWKDGHPRICLGVNLDGRATFSGISEPTGKYSMKSGWNYGFCLDKFVDVTPENAARPADPTAPAISFRRRGSVSDFLAGVISQ